MLENLGLYLKYNGLSDVTTVTQNEDGTFKITAVGDDILTIIQDIKDQVDRDDEHPITIMDVDFITTVVSQDETSVTVNIVPVIK